MFTKQQQNTFLNLTMTFLNLVCYLASDSDNLKNLSLEFTAIVTGSGTLHKHDVLALLPMDASCFSRMSWQRPAKT